MLIQYFCCIENKKVCHTNIAYEKIKGSNIQQDAVVLNIMLKG